MDVKYTGGLPICPNCQKGTNRQLLGTMSTCLGFSAVYDEKGNDVTVNPNTVTSEFYCAECRSKFAVKHSPWHGASYITPLMPK